MATKQKIFRADERDLDNLNHIRIALIEDGQQGTDQQAFKLALEMLRQHVDNRRREAAKEQE